MWVRHYASWIQPFPGGIFTKGEICWAMYTTNDEELMGSIWFRPQGLKTDMLSMGMASLHDEDATSIIANRGCRVLHGHNLLKPAPTLYKPLPMHERPAK